MTDGRISGWPARGNIRIVADCWTQPFWDAARTHSLVVQRCMQCSRMRIPPTPFCPQCRSQDCDWPELSGDGTIYSFTVVAPPRNGPEADLPPYAPALIEFPDAPGVRLPSAIVDAPLAMLRIGAAVKLVWQDTDDCTLPRFRLA